MEYTTKKDIRNRAEEIKGKTQAELIQELNFKVNGKKNKMGDLFEAWFGKTLDSDSKPDLGIVELKATPFKKLKKRKNGKEQYSAKERLVLNIINYMELVNEPDFEHSHLVEKNRTLEIAFYEYIKEVPTDEWSFAEVIMYEMLKNKSDYKIIKNDWETIQKYVKDGHAEDLSDSLTNYLAACTKGKDSNSVRDQPFSNVRARQRAFSFKTSFMTRLLRNNVLGNEPNSAIITDDDELDTKSLTDIVLDRINEYKGMNRDDLLKKFEIKSNAKSINNIIARSMLGLNKSSEVNNIDEFEKASIIPKTILFNRNGTNQQSMSLPTFKFKDLVNQNWESEDGEAEADLNVYVSESKFLFIVFQKDDNNQVIFKGAKFYRIPKKQIEVEIKSVWEDTKRKLLEGIHLEYNNKTREVKNNFIGAKEKMVVHVRPHSGHASYINNSDANKLPHPAIWTNKPNDGLHSDDYLTNQSFWLNNRYVKEVVKDLLY